MSGNIQSTFYAVSLLILGGRYYYYPHFRDKLRLRKVRKVTKDHVASKWEWIQTQSLAPKYSLNNGTKLPLINSRWIKLSSKTIENLSSAILFLLSLLVLQNFWAMVSACRHVGFYTQGMYSVMGN